jgi:hypothetical protein
MVEHAGVHDRALNGPVGSSCRHHDESVIERDEAGESGEVTHHPVLPAPR